MHKRDFFGRIHFLFFLVIIKFIPIKYFVLVENANNSSSFNVRVQAAWFKAAEVRGVNVDRRTNKVCFDALGEK